MGPEAIRYTSEWNRTDRVMEGPILDTYIELLKVIHEDLGIAFEPVEANRPERPHRIAETLEQRTKRVNDFYATHIPRPEDDNETARFNFAMQSRFDDQGNPL